MADFPPFLNGYKHLPPEEFKPKSLTEVPKTRFADANLARVGTRYEFFKKEGLLNRRTLENSTWWQMGYGRLLVLATLFVLLVSASTWGQSRNNQLVEINFNNVDLVNFLAIMSETLGMPFAWDEKQITGKITLISPTKFSPEDAYRIFETALAMQGYTTVRTEGSPVIQVVPTKDAPRMAGVADTGTERVSGPGNNNLFVTQVVPLRFADANQVRAVLVPITSQTAAIAAYQPANVLVISDTESNLRRLLKIVAELDIEPGDVEFRIIKVQHASANRLATLIQQLDLTRAVSPAGPPQPGRPALPGAGGSTAKVVAEERTNSLLLVADPATLARLVRVVAELDVPGESTDLGLKVYQLSYADAEELAQILTTVSQGVGQQATATRPGPVAPATQGQVAGSNVSITADKPTNSLIVFGTPDDFAMMDQLVKQLDVRRRQVFVEALIMEMTFEKSLNLGVSWQALGTDGTNVGSFGFPTATPQNLTAAMAGGAGAVMGILGDSITYQGQNFLSFSAFVQATQHDQDLNILANPQLLTLNNEQATINVSQVIPVSSKTVVDPSGLTTTQYEFKDVGIILQITPQITGEDKVHLTINQESSSVANATGDAVTTLKRTITTQVLVDNGTTVAIGGLIQDQQTNTVSIVPCIGEIPVVGWLFRAQQQQIRKTNLIVFIRPRIIISQQELEAMTDELHLRFEDATEEAHPSMLGGELPNESEFWDMLEHNALAPSMGASMDDEQ